MKTISKLSSPLSDRKSTVKKESKIRFDTPSFSSSEKIDVLENSEQNSKPPPPLSSSKNMVSTSNGVPSVSAMKTLNKASKQSSSVLSKPPSPFLSFFSRRKRVTKSVEDLKEALESPKENGFIHIDNDVTDRNDEVDSWNAASSFHVTNGKPSIAPASPRLIDRIRSCRNAPVKSKSEMVTLDSNKPNNTLPKRHTSKESKKSKAPMKMSMSVDSIYISNSSYLMEALETLADVPPIVARSIPKHAVIDTTDFAERSLDNCLFDSSVYDGMLCDSLKVCELLQTHLNKYISSVRGEDDEEFDLNSETTTTTFGNSSNLVVRAADDPRRLSALTNATTVSSTIDDV